MSAIQAELEFAHLEQEVAQDEEQGLFVLKKINVLNINFNNFN